MSTPVTPADRLASLLALAYASPLISPPVPDAVIADVAQAIEDARQAGATHQRRITAAHVFDRAEQYEHSSGIYEALTQVAASIAEGDAEEADRHGEFEPELLARVDRIAARRRG